MTDQDKLKLLTEKADCCASNTMAGKLIQKATECGVKLTDPDESKAAQWRLCAKVDMFPRFLWPPGVEAGECSICKCDVAWTPKEIGPTVLICIDCALKQADDQEVSE